MSDTTEHAGYSAAQQGAEVPVAWKPTRDKPIPVVRCEVVKKDGARCGRWSVRGLTKCASHLRNAHHNLEHVANRIEATKDAARMRIFDDLDLAVDTLEDLLRPGTAEAIRLRAAESLLDRGGLKNATEINVEVTNVGFDPAAEIRKRLSHLVAPAQPELEAEEIHEAEIVAEDDVPPEDTLF